MMSETLDGGFESWGLGLAQVYSMIYLVVDAGCRPRSQLSCPLEHLYLKFLQVPQFLPTRWPSYKGKNHQKAENIIAFSHLAWETMQHHYCCILSIRSKSLMWAIFKEEELDSILCGKILKDFACIFLKHNLLESKGHGIKTQVAWFHG